jgi:hypothetical protein
LALWDRTSIVLLTGRMGAGKDTVCNLMAAHAPPGVRIHRLAFADTLKARAAAAVGLTVDTLERFKRNATVSIADLVRRFPATEPDPAVSACLAALVASTDLAAIGVRTYLQAAGAALRGLGPDTLTAPVVASVQKALQVRNPAGADVFVVTDVRFLQERHAVVAAFAQDVPVITLCVVRTDGATVPTGPAAHDVSETEVQSIPADAFVRNTFAGHAALWKEIQQTVSSI